jgi:hypothetical protein
MPWKFAASGFPEFILFTARGFVMNPNPPVIVPARFGSRISSK